MERDKAFKTMVAGPALNGANGFGATIKSVPTTSLRTAKIDIITDLQDFDASPYRCYCNIVIVLLPCVKEL